MKAIIMAGGYAKRMWPLTIDIPKPLLPIAGRPVIEYVLEKLKPLNDVQEVYITTNRKFEGAFREWLEGLDYLKEIRLVVEETQKEEEKLGSVGAMKHILDNEDIDDDVICLAGDNLFQDSLDGLLDLFRKHNAMVFGLWEMQDRSALPRFGIASIDQEGKVTDFEEKPENPRSNLVSTGLYIIPRSSLGLIHEYLAGNNNPDTFGYFIRWLYKRSPVYTHVFKNLWFDIGSFEVYEQANVFIKNNSKGST
jgi:glucose-1-phosphate thymidylyltransferase